MKHIRIKHIATLTVILGMAALIHLHHKDESIKVTATEPAKATPKQSPVGTHEDFDSHEVFKKEVAPFFNQYCVSCHGPDKSKGKITVHSLAGDLSKGQELDKWESILDMLEAGEMPPSDEPQPKPEEAKVVMEWIESGMQSYVEKASEEVPAPMMRRMTNVEYENTLSELLGFEFSVLDDLSADPEHFYHFNNTADLMRIGPEQWDRYLDIAREAMRAAIVGPEKPKPYILRQEWSSQGSDKGLGQDEVTAFGGARHFWNGVTISGFPRNGEFRLRLSASAILPPGHNEATVRLNMGEHQGGNHNEKASKDIATFTLTNNPDEPKILEFRGRIENHPFATEPEEKGPNKGKIVDKMSLRTLVSYDDGTLNDGAQYAYTRQLTMPRAVINWMELEVPVTDVWPPQHHTNILFESPLRETNERAYVQAVLDRFMSRAYRRPVTAEEVDRYTKIYELVRPTLKSFEEAIRETLAMVLISPRFLYHTESDSRMGEQFALASRLSYFLWASMPDQELFGLAYKGQLNHPKVIEQQVLRMLKDKRSEKFIEDFTVQWLSIEKSLTVPINRDLYPRFLYGGEKEVPYRHSTRDYMIQESVGFVSHLIQENKSLFNIVDSDFAILNERLAAHYGVEGVRGMAMRPVPIKPEHHLGGLLTHGSVLVGNGTGTAPHPIYRAVWLREAILGDTVAPPPADVPALSDSAGESLEQALSIAQLLAKHRTQESCKDCHFRLDPWGIPFERYNAIGQYQPKVPKDGTKVSGFQQQRHIDLKGYKDYIESLNVIEVDAQARVPHGPKVDGMQHLKDYLLDERKDAIANNVIKRLVTYGIGRHLTYRDRFAVKEIYGEAKTNDFKMRDIIVSICKSDIFRESTNQEN